MPIVPNRHLAFTLIVSVGLVYFSTIALSSHKVISAFLMQFIYLYQHQSVDTTLLFFNLFVGFLYFYLFFFIGRGAVLTTLDYFRTRQYLRSSARLFKPLAFTAGLFRPRIYISPILKKISTAQELRAIILHEQSHQANFDPLRDLIVKFISLSLPPLPLMSLLFDYYHTVVETACDLHACQYLSSPRPIVSALSKVMSVPSLALSHFSAQTERIKILTGHSRLSPTPFVLLYFSFIFLFVTSSTFVSRTNLIPGCDHLLLCLELIFHPPTCP